MAITKWTTNVIYVNIETGEIIPKEQKENYTIINNEISYELTDKYAIRKLTYFCEPNRQQRLF